MGDSSIKLNDEQARAQLLAEATTWLLSNATPDNKVIKNLIIANIYKLSDCIKDVQLLIDLNNHKMLIYIGLSSFGRMFKRRSTSKDTLIMMQDAFPDYQFRVIFDQELFLKALSQYQRLLVKNEEAIQKRREERLKRKQEEEEKLKKDAEEAVKALKEKLDQKES